MNKNDDFHDFDPYEWMIEISLQLEQLTKMHNELVTHYQQTVTRLRITEEQLISIQQQQIMDE